MPDKVLGYTDSLEGFCDASFQIDLSINDLEKSKAFLLSQRELMRNSNRPKF